MGREGSDGLKVDPNLKSFLFTLRNRYNIPARSFKLKTTQGGQRNLLLFMELSALWWRLCIRRLQLKHQQFQVKEMKVFKITDEISFASNGACVLFANFARNPFLAVFLESQLRLCQSDQ
jgi:hypothetical protein